MINIINKLQNEFGNRGYIWEDDTIPTNKNRFNWSLNYESIPRPNQFSDEYIKKFPKEFSKPSIKELILIFLKLQKNEPSKRFKGV
jgi:hypothetical protein